MKKLVFIIEDSPIQQKMLRVHFEEMLGNYEVKTFADPDDMFEHIKDKPFAIVLDHFFNDKKEKNGLDYLREIRKKHKSIPVIYYTSLDDEKIRTEVLALGAEEFIIKNSASLVRLRTALDAIHSRKRSFFTKIFGH
ncbi:MAG TPA: response regulator [Chryseosolibacter sp.]